MTLEATEYEIDNGAAWIRLNNQQPEMLYRRHWSMNYTTTLINLTTILMYDAW